MSQPTEQATLEGAEEPKCASCYASIYGQFLVAMGRNWCPEHLRCGFCQSPLTDGLFEQAVDGDTQPFCAACYEHLFVPRCLRCWEAVRVGEPYVSALGTCWHRDCFQCAQCDAPMEPGEFAARRGEAVCLPCASGAGPSDPRRAAAAAAAASSPSPAAAEAKAAEAEPAAGGAEVDGEEAQKLRKTAATKFNIKPREGIEFLKQRGVIDDSPESLARYLHGGDEGPEGLSKRKIGELLGKSDEFNQQLLAAYMKLTDWTGMTLVQALRRLLLGFRLPGESQQIDRILEVFAIEYHSLNPESFAHPDVAYVLAFSLIMLNTDLHNPSIKAEKKMTLDGFISNNRGINQGADLDRNMLVALYEDIKNNEIRMSEGDMAESEVVTFIAPTRSGWLRKEAGGRKFGFHGQHRFWFVLADSCLYYFVDPADEDPRCIIPLEMCGVRAGNDSKTFAVFHTAGDVVKSVKLLPSGAMEQGSHSQFVLRAANRQERDAWVQSIQREVARSPFYDLLQRKKEQLDQGITHIGPPTTQGWMWKKGAVNTGWRKRYCTLYVQNPPRLYYHVNQRNANKMSETGENLSRGFVDMTVVSQVRCSSGDTSAPDAAFELVTPDRVYAFCPNGAHEFQNWITTLSSLCGGS